jgi:hypothetical protein
MNSMPRLQSRRSLALLAATFVVAVSAGLAISGGTAAPASAGTPCWRTLINDWFDGKIDHVYPRHCYTQAIAHLPNDIQTYSNAADEIHAAMLAALRHNNDGGNSGNSGNSGTPGAPATVDRTPQSVAPPASSEPDKKGVILRAIEWLGPSDAGAVPLPLLVLAGVAFLLLALAGGSLLNRHLQTRRLQPPQP